MNSSEARRQRREEERAQRRRDERLAEKAEREAEEQREAERAEELRRQEAQREAEARAADERARERRAQRLANLRRERTAATRRAESRDERRRVARAERVEGEREAERSEQRLEQLREERREQQHQEQRAADRQAEAEQAAGEERRRERASEEESAARTEEAHAAREAERRARAREEEQAQQRAAELRTADAERRAEERRAAEGEAERVEQLLAQRRGELLEERRRLEREAEARAERLRAARDARARELLQERAAAEAERERANERRAMEARRRGADRKAQEKEGPSELPWLRTEGARIVEWGGAPRVLRGVNVVGLDEAALGGTPLRDALALDDRNLEELTDRWGASVVRVPFSAGTILGVPPVLDDLDELVNTLAGWGLYVLLALSDGAQDVWTLLGDRYQNQPAALFEATVTEQALDLVATIRAIHQSSLLFLPMSGGVLPAPNIVYTLRDTTESRPRLDETFAAFAAQNPVLVSEWGNEGPDFGRSAMANAGLFERLEIGWCACNWNAPPRLVADASRGRFSETRFGLIVRRALAAPVRPALTPF